jgi:hypothetical protein
MAQARGPLVSSVAALGSLVAAVSCCLPFGTFLLAGAAAGASRILNPLRPWLLFVSIVALVVGFVQAYGRSHCSLRRNPVTVLLLWVSAVLVLTMLIFPQMVAGFLADRFSGGVK